MIFKKDNPNKIFVISFQRTGTTSTGKFFKDHGFVVADWHVNRKNNWGELCFKGDYESIFKSDDFKKCQVFEDGPWWYADFYKVLFHRFPKSKFVLLERASDKWFNSMLNHSGGKTLGNSFRHMSFYNRLSEYYSTASQIDIENPDTNIIDNKFQLGEEYRSHYEEIYKNRNMSIQTFFNQFDKNRLFHSTLESPSLWQDMAKFFSIPISQEYRAHVNKSVVK